STLSLLVSLFALHWRLPCSSLFPYTTLFRSLVMMVIILLAVDRKIVGYCFLGFAIGESLGASALRIAGGIFTKIADIGSDLMKIDRKSTRLNSSHVAISYAVFCLKKKSQREH